MEHRVFQRASLDSKEAEKLSLMNRGEVVLLTVSSWSVSLALGIQVADPDDGCYFVAFDDDIGSVKANLNSSDLLGFLQLSGQCQATLPHVLQLSSRLGVTVWPDRESGIIRQDLHRCNRLSIPGFAPVG